MRPREAGFSLLDLVLAMALMTMVMAGVAGLLSPSQGAFGREPEAADMQQRLRVASDALFTDLLVAGGGAYLGGQKGPLGYFFAPVLPYRAGVIRPDPPGTFRRDAITVLYVPPTASQATLRLPVPDASADLQVDNDPGCPVGDALCGFRQDMGVLLYDDTGAFDTFTIAAVQGDAARLRHNPNPLARAYPAATKAVQVASHTYFIDRAAFQLVHYDGGAGADAPVVDHVVDLAFAYYGEALPPTLIKAVTEPDGPWTTYGPKPGPPGVPSGTAWPDGENCVFVSDAAGGPLPLPRLAVLGGGGPALIKLEEAQLTDGPFCPDGTSPNRFDADLLRVRRIGVTLRVEAALAALRGPAGALFANAGTSRAGHRWAPDLEVRFDVTPRNLNLSR